MIKGILEALAVGLLVGCAMSPDQKAYRERLESGFLTPQDVQRFKTTDREHEAIVASARDHRSPPVQDVDIQLVEAAARGDVAAIRSLIGNGARVNAMDAQQRTPLLAAAREGEVESVRLLLRAGADVEGRGGAMPPLAAAALRGHVNVVRLLIRNHARLDAVGENDQTALMNAVKLNRMEVVRALLEAGANTKVTDRNGANLLVVCVAQEQPEMLTLLLKHKVYPDMMDADGLTALYWAEFFKRPQLAEVLRQAGANPSRTRVDLVQTKPLSMGEMQ